ncbi:MAG: hypothetical protein ACFFFT_07420 [Candidatus Thorarchaeota archaeon]
MEEVSSSPTREYNKTQKKVSGAFYILIVIASLVTIGGLVWTAADIFIDPTDKWELFLDLNLGYKIAIVGGLLAGLFFLLVFFYGLFKKTSRSLMVFIYKKRELETKYKNRPGVKIAAGGLLISLIGILIGFILVPIWNLIITEPEDSGKFFTFLGSTGPWVLLVGTGLFLIIGVSLFMIYFWKNGYYLILRLIGSLEKEDK